jgi:mRNA interferase MazF
MHFNHGDVVLILFPDSNLRTAKRRPALIVLADGLHTALPQTVVAMITSNMARAAHPSRIKVLQASSEGRAMGLLTDSVIMTDNLATVLHSEIDRVIGHSPDMVPIQTALRHTFSL